MAFGSIDLHSVRQAWHLVQLSLATHATHKIHTQLFHIQLSHTYLFHIIYLPPSPRNSYTHFFTHNLLTDNLLTSNSLTRNSLIRTSFTQSALRHPHRTHAYFFTNLLTDTSFSHRTLSLDLSSTISFLFPAFPIPSSPFFCYLLKEIDMWGYPVL